MSHSNRLEPKVLEDASIYNEPFKIPSYCMFHNYVSIMNKCCYIVDRSYERLYKWFYLTFKPFNSTYEKYNDFYQTKGFDHCRKKLGKVGAYIITREIRARKTHINILCVTTRDLSKELHEKKTNKYFIYCQESISRHDTLHYILKESKERYFKEYKDYTFHCK